MGDIKLRDEVLSIHADVTAVATAQNALFGTLGSRVDGVAHQIDMSSQAQIQQLDTIRSSCERVNSSQNAFFHKIGDQYDVISDRIQTVQDGQRQSSDSLHSSLQCLALGQSTLSATIETKFDEVLAQTRVVQSMQAQCQRQHPNLVNRRLTLEDMSAFGMICRAELRQQMEVLSGRFDGVARLTDAIAMAISEQAHLMQTHEEVPRANMQPQTKPPTRTSGTIRYQQTAQTWDSERVPTESQQYTGLKQEVVLWTIDHMLTSGICDIRARVEAYRRRGLHSERRFFRLKVLVLPRPWILSRGLSVMCSTGPNAYGHYDICPSIMPFRIIPMSSPIYDMLTDVLWADDLSAFQKLLFDGTVTLRDIFEDDRNILGVCVALGVQRVYRS